MNDVESASEIIDKVQAILIKKDIIVEKVTKIVENKKENSQLQKN
jgi:hypothetical protein